MSVKDQELHYVTCLQAFPCLATVVSNLATGETNCNCKIKYIKQSYSQPWKKFPFVLLCNSQCLQILHVLLTAQMSHWNISQLHLPLESCCTNKRSFFTSLQFEVEQASRGLSAIAELLVVKAVRSNSSVLKHVKTVVQHFVAFCGVIV